MSATGVRSYQLALIADDDKFSKSADNTDTWYSVLLKGNLDYNKSTKKMSIRWESDTGTRVPSGYAYSGRGMELSDLLLFKKRLYSVDDKTGIVFELVNGQAAPWAILGIGDGKQNKGFKGEWMTIKNGVMFVGGHGTLRYKDGARNIGHRWIKTIREDIRIRISGWSERIATNYKYDEKNCIAGTCVTCNICNQYWSYTTYSSSKFNLEKEQKGNKKKIYLPA